MSLWIDLTDFLKWSGNLTGIQRIQYNLSRKYIQSGRKVRFFIYDEGRRTFEEVQFNPDEVVRHGIVSNPAPVSNEQKYKYTAKFVRGMRRITGDKVPRGTREVGEPQSPFDSGDTVLVMGGIWVGSFIDDLTACKEKHQFKFIHFAFDMIPTLFPGYVVEWLPDTFSTYQKKVFSIAEGVISISESTKRDVLRFIQDYAIRNNPTIQTVRIGEDIHINKLNDGDNLSEEVSELAEQEFILSVSTLEARKNHAALFYVVKEARRRGVLLPKIVIAGRNGWLTDDIRYVIAKDPESSSSIIILNEVDDRELDWLYKNCKFTIFPSFYEGWGMPIAESLAYGKLCLASDTSSMPEIAGDLIDYFSPYDTGMILDQITKYLDDSVLAAKMDEIKNKYHHTSWDDMFRQVAAFVDSV